MTWAVILTLRPIYFLESSWVPIKFNAGWVPDECWVGPRWMLVGPQMNAGWTPDKCWVGPRWMPGGPQMNAGWAPDECWVGPRIGLDILENS
jgi:hypothetical protein